MRMDTTLWSSMLKGRCFDEHFLSAQANTHVSRGKEKQHELDYIELDAGLKQDVFNAEFMRS